MRRFASSLPAALAAILCLAALGSGPALAGDGAPASSFSHRIAQGEFFLESGLIDQALREFRAAVAMPEARDHSKVYILLARTEYLAGDLSAAVDAIRSAHALEGSFKDPELTELHEFLTTRFGKVLVIGAGTDGAVMPVPAVTILDPEVKRVFELAIERLEGPASSGSTSIHLPVGSYRVGRHLVEVRAQGTARMDLRKSVVSSAGVYGERAGPGGRRTGGGPAQPTGLVGASSFFVIRFGGMGFEQQKAPSGGGRLLLGGEGQLTIPLGFRVAFALDVTRIERITASRPAPPGIAPGLHVAAGPTLKLGADVQLLPWLAWNLSYGHPIEVALPPGYAGPVHYLITGPDVELRLLLPRTEGSRGVLVWPELTARLLFRETRPLGVLDSQDPRPHLSVGGGFDIGLRLGR